MLRKQVLTVVQELISWIIFVVIAVTPLFFLPITTDFFETPKQVLIVAATALLLVLYGARSILEGRFSYRHGPFGFGLFIFLLVVILSIIFAAVRATSTLAGIPLVAMILFSFIVVNTLQAGRDHKRIIIALLTSAALVGLVNLLQFLKLFVLPYPIAKVSGFALPGSLLESAIFLFILLPLGVFAILAYLQAHRDDIFGGIAIGTTTLTFLGAMVALFQLVTSLKPLLLPQSVGLRTALQSISLNFQSAAFGTGPGTYLFDFTRFRDPILNTGNLWNIRFASSSSYLMEVLATLGVIGLVSLGFIFFQLFQTFFKHPSHNKLTIGAFLSLVLAFVFALFLPFATVSTFTLFILVALYTLLLMREHPNHVKNVILSINALIEGNSFIETEPYKVEEQPRIARVATDLLPYSMCIVFVGVGVWILLGLGGWGYNLIGFVHSDLTFQKAIVAASKNKAKDTYDLQLAAINEFPNRDFYHRIFSQTNLAIANSIVSSAQATGSGKPAQLSTDDQQRVITLVQQAINFARNATIVSPLNVVNWENLSTTYRNLIGLAQNADQFAIVSAQQAISLDPTNVLLRIQLGGIYYQLQSYDAAIQQFSAATQLKPDFANAHYNLGHAYEAKGGDQNLLAAYQEYLAVQNSVDRDSDNYKKISDEIKTLEPKLPKQQQSQGQSQQLTPQRQDTSREPLQISTQSGALKNTNQKVQVSPPPPPATQSAQPAQTTP